MSPVPREEQSLSLPQPGILRCSGLPRGQFELFASGVNAPALEEGNRMTFTPYSERSPLGLLDSRGVCVLMSPYIPCSVPPAGLGQAAPPTRQAPLTPFLAMTPIHPS